MIINAKSITTFFSFSLLTILLMAAAPQPTFTSIAASQIILRSGTVVTAEVIEELNSTDLEVGNFVRLEVRGDVRVNGKVVIRDGAMAEGKVFSIRKDCQNCQHQLQVTLESAQAVDGQRIRLRGPARKATGRCNACDARINIGTTLTANVLSDANIQA